MCLHFCNMTILLCTCVFSVPEEQTATPIPAAGLTLEVLTTTVCFNKAVKLLCRHPDVLESGIFSTTRPSWKENGTVVALDGGMYRSAKQINETQVILELVPERSHFEPSGAHNYTCFLPLAGGGALESNLILIRPRGMHGMHYTRVRHPFWDTMNNGTPVLRRPRADCHHSWTVGRPRETNMVRQPRARLASSTKSRS